MQTSSLPAILECMTLRLCGHAVYDKGDYMPAEQMRQWRARDPVPAARQKLLDIGGMSEAGVAAVEQRIDEELHAALALAMPVKRPDADQRPMSVFAEAACEGAARPPRSTDETPMTGGFTGATTLPPYRAAKVKNGDAVTRAMDYILEHDLRAFLFGLDVGTYGSAFKTCKGLIERHGADRVLDMPLCESALVGFALGASQLGQRPILEFQFADFSTEVASQLGLNASSWYFRTGRPAPLLLRLPCGGGLTMGAFHSGEFEGLWSRFPGLKLLYPATAQETFEALVAGYCDPNPCLVFEHKLLYWSKTGEIDFGGDVKAVWRPRRYTEGTDVTLVAFGAMVHEALAAASAAPAAIEVWNPFVLQPMDLGPIVESVRKTGRLLVVQECGATQGLGDQVISGVCREALAALKCPPRLLSAPNLPVPFAPELESYYRPNSRRIQEMAEQMVRLA
jgi:2-oxoisovalerate dehydrogenase E1 component